ncbi:hypothetical protein F5X98DRAFT_383556 [Xylaria grammica]|nr:hypothetical protein F5X98DRAFT_383556 [Xylaria grammica]
MKTTPQASHSFLLNEVSICWSLIKSNIDGAFLPFPVFTMASLLHRGAVWYEVVVGLAYTLIYAFFYTYVFEFANQTGRPESLIEDKINKPDRPLVVESMTLQSAKFRYYVGLAVWFAYSYALGVHLWTLLWFATFFAAWNLGLSGFGPTKDLSISLGTIAQLMAAGHIGGLNALLTWHWVKVLIAWMFTTIGIQDLRDVPGDLAIGRRTTVILLGDVSGMTLILASNHIVFFQYIYISQRVLESRYDTSTLTVSAAIAASTAGIIFRLFAWRTIESDRVTYRCYMSLYLLNLVAAGVCLRK